MSFVITFETALWLLYGVLFLLFRLTDDSDAKVALISGLMYGVCWRRSKQRLESITHM